jgi:hypothetical protein
MNKRVKSRFLALLKMTVKKWRGRFLAALRNDNTQLEEKGGG